MILQKLYLHNFRNYESQDVEFHSGINHLVGDNGQGKTNLLESIYCLGLAKSFRTNKDSDLIRKGNEEFQIYGEFLSDHKVKHKVGITATKSHKAISIDRKRIQKHSELIGKIPVVLFNPEDHKITSGPPAERRKWLDVVLSQSDHQYLKNLQIFKRTLKQKNHLLDCISRKEANLDQLLYWNQIFAQVAVKIIFRRVQLIEAIRNEIQQFYKTISASATQLDIFYQFSGGMENKEQLEFENLLNRARDKEIGAKSALYGPHRDDLDLALDEKDVRRHASRGEHKSILLALKLVEYNFLHKTTATKPILLLDDIYSELDSKRQAQIIAHLSQMGQTFITSTFYPAAQPTEAGQVFRILNGYFAENYDR